MDVVAAHQRSRPVDIDTPAGVTVNRVAADSDPGRTCDDAAAKEDHLVVQSIIEDGGAVVRAAQEDAVEEVAIDVAVRDSQAGAVGIVGGEDTVLAAGHAEAVQWHV